MVVQWFKDRKEIHSDHKYQVDFTENTATVQITNLEQSDSGVYMCQASNDAGETKTSGILSVKGQSGKILSLLALADHFSFFL